MYEFDEINKKRGNYYRTYEDAQKSLEKPEAIEKVKDYIKDNFGYDPEKWAEYEWGSNKINKYILGYDYTNDSLNKYIYFTSKTYSPIGYLKTEEDCNELIKEMKEELEIIYK